MSLTLKQIRYFIAAAEAGQISQAAIEMNISQSAVTAAVQNLEAVLGVALLRRTHGGVELTIEGGRFLARARNIMAAVDDAVRSPLGDERQERGVLRIGMTYTVTGYFLPRYYARFASTHPGITIELKEMARRDLEAALVRGEVELALMLVSNLANRAEIASEILLRSRRQLWLSSDHPLCQVPAITLADVAREPFILLTVDEASQTAALYWEKAGLRPDVRVETYSVEAVRSLVAAGVGVAILSDMVYRPWSLEGQRLEQRQLADPVPSMDVGLAWRQGARLSPPAEFFRAFMRLVTAPAAHAG